MLTMVKTLNVTKTIQKIQKLQQILFRIISNNIRLHNLLDQQQKLSLDLQQKLNARR